MKPLIGISGGIGYRLLTTEVYHNPQPLQQLNDDYVISVERAGGIPVILPVLEDPTLAREALDRVDGVILSGGSDIDPLLYGQRPTGKLGPVIPRRDALDYAIADYVLRRTDKPLLGICRGTQMMNVVMGGTLHIDLAEEGAQHHRLNMYPRTQHTHQAIVAEGTKLGQVVGSGVVGVNSLHHQAVKDLGEGFIVAARSIPDDVVEAIEMPGERFVVGVQWHPEMLLTSENHQKLFCSLVQAAQADR